MRAVEMASGSGADQIADPAVDLGVPVGLQLRDRGIADQPQMVPNSARYPP